MEKGSLRADVNVSVRRPGAPLGTRCEIKNVNSIRFVGQAIDYEARRQIDILEDGGTIDQETRLFDSEQGRDALDAHQGRGARLSLLPRPGSAAARIRRGLCRRAEGGTCRNCRTRRRRASPRATGSPPTTPTCWSPSARSPTISRRWRKGRDAKAAANWVINELTGRLNKEGKDIAAVAGQRGAARRDPRSDRGRHHFGQDRQGCVRDRLERGRRSARDRRSSAA